MPSMLLLSEACREAFIHDKHVIMGREMQPFCCDHLDILLALDSPLVMGGAVTIHDAQIGIKLCSTATNAAYFDATLRPDKYWLKWAKKTVDYPIATFIGLWDRYIDDYSPKFEMFHQDDSEASKLPGHILTAARLIERGHEPAKVRRMAIGEITVWALAIMENNPTPENPKPLKMLKDDWDIETAREKAALEAQSNGR